MAGLARLACPGARPGRGDDAWPRGPAAARPDRPPAVVSTDPGHLPPGDGAGLPRGVLVAGRPGRRADREPGDRPRGRIPGWRGASPRRRSLLADTDGDVARSLGPGPARPLLGRGRHQRA